MMAEDKSRHGRNDPAPTEQDIRVELAACYRIFDMLGWTELIFNHITAKVPGPDEHFLINPFGLNYSEVTASNLVKIDLDGDIIGDSEWPVNGAGYIIHGAIHGARPDVHCVILGPLLAMLCLEYIVLGIVVKFSACHCPGGCGHYKR